MKIVSQIVCRANEKVYERIRVFDSPENARLSVIVRDDGSSSHNLPCTIYPINDTDFVLVYPVLNMESATCELGLYSLEGHLLDSYVHDVQFVRVKWQSRYNYKMHGRACSEIRCIDERADYRYGDIDLSIESAVGFPDKLLLQVRLVVPNVIADSLRVDCLESSLRSIALDIRESGRYCVSSEIPGAPDRVSISLSLMLPWGLDKVFVRVWSSSVSEYSYIKFLDAREWEALLSQSDELFYKDAHCDPYYAEWFESHKATKYALDMQRIYSEAWSYRPKFSLVVPLYRTPLCFAHELLSSVMGQTYTNWELIYVNASPADEELSRFIDSACSNDERIKSVELEHNLGISLNTNEGISRATGDYISFLDHDDLIEPDLLFEYAKAIVAGHKSQMPVDVLYCDEDKLYPDGIYRDVFFKPDFSLDLLRNNNYICHMLTIRRSVLDCLSLSTSEYDGAQDHNLVLAASEVTSSICHIPKVLYHWRVAPNSTAGGESAKPWAADAGVRAVSAHLERLGINASVSAADDMAFTYNVNYSVPSSRPLVSIIIPNKDQVELLTACIESIIEKSTYDRFEIVIVENNSTTAAIEDYYQSLEANKSHEIRVVRWTGPFNYSAIVNYGCSEANGDYYLLLNNDTEIISCDWIERLLGNAARKEVGAVGPKLYFANDTIQHAGISLANTDCAPMFQGLPRFQKGCFAFAARQRNVLAVTAACLMVRKEVFNEVGGFDEKLAVAYNDADFCFKLHAAGYLNVFIPAVELYHYESLTRGYDADVKGNARLRKELAVLTERWATLFAEGDPFYNPNLQRTPPGCCFYRF